MAEKPQPVEYSTVRFAVYQRSTVNLDPISRNASPEADSKEADKVAQQLQSTALSSGSADGSAPSDSNFESWNVGCCGFLVVLFDHIELNIKSGASASKQEEVKRLPGGKIKRKEKQEVVIEKIVRNKRKCITTVKGLELFGIKLSDASKKLGKKFATGASVVKGPTEKEQIDVQGDIAYDIVEFITETWPDAASSLRINLAKSELIPVGEVEDIEDMAVELGCRVGDFSIKYLGLPLGAHHKALSMWDGMEERMRRRLDLWKRHYLSKGGRITLIKRGSLKRKIHLINWEVVCTQKEKGGLGIRKIVLLNKALLGKWIWRFAFEKDLFWKKVIGVKYGQEGCGWRTNEARGIFGVGVWKEILKEASWCWDNIEFKLYAMAVFRNATVNEVWDSSLGQGRWNLKLSRDSNDWELDLIEELLLLLRDFRISSEEDSVLWKRGGLDIFRIQDAYNLLAAPNPLVFPKKSIWMDKVPTKVAFFAWEAIWEKNPHWSGSSERSSFPCLGLSGCSQRQSKRVYMEEESSSVLGFLERSPKLQFSSLKMGERWQPPDSGILACQENGACRVPVGVTHQTYYVFNIMAA
ncbi:Translation machinery-associated protein 22 [Vitis vinifera]|uniref:Translation machinery-associated protein 22 n=1 Tax=Vitis vinifera TaxID=29760 RepID=A0A438E8H9_VITVI|nr:Translation machinery-associated protein 22 [Vitis vinifera]